MYYYMNKFLFFSIKKFVKIYKNISEYENSLIPFSEQNCVLMLVI